MITKILNHAESEVTAVYDRHRYDLEKRRALTFGGAAGGPRRWDWGRQRCATEDSMNLTDGFGEAEVAEAKRLFSEDRFVAIERILGLTDARRRIEV